MLLSNGIFTAICIAWIRINCGAYYFQDLLLKLELEHILKFWVDFDIKCGTEYLSRPFLQQHNNFIFPLRLLQSYRHDVLFVLKMNAPKKIATISSRRGRVAPTRKLICLIFFVLYHDLWTASRDLGRAHNYNVSIKVNFQISIADATCLCATETRYGKATNFGQIKLSIQFAIPRLTLYHHFAINMRHFFYICVKLMSVRK